jgi:hypothetical protein
MQTQELVQVIAQRTGLTHDDILLVFEVTKQIAKERLGVYEGLVVCGMFRLSAQHSTRWGWRAKLSLYKEMEDAVGADVRAIDD